MDLVMIEFGVTETKENIRLRKWYKKYEYMEDDYTGKENYAVGDLGLQSFSHLKIEIKKEGETFEKYNKNSRFYRITFWSEGITGIKDLPFERFFFDYTLKSKEMVK